MNANLAPDDEDVGNNGERMIVLNAWLYWAHLSIYRFALPFVAGRHVLEAGAGEGYGAAYLVRHGAASVRALEFSPQAVQHAERKYAGNAVRYEVADLNQPLPLGDRSVDVVFSSNVFEHIGRVDVLAAETARVVAPQGVVIVAVPPVTSAAVLEADMHNQFHVHHIPPSAWEAKLLRFFADVRCHAHRGRGVFASKAREQEEIALPPDRVSIRETDFEFPETTGPALDRDAETITAIFVCRAPRAVPGPETIAERTPAEWCEGQVAARLIARERAAASEARAAAASLAALPVPAMIEPPAAEVPDTAALARAMAVEARLAAIEASTIWRAAGPLRGLMNRLRPPRG